jgi:hypothetical protein
VLQPFTVLFVHILVLYISVVNLGTEVVLGFALSVHMFQMGNSQEANGKYLRPVG